MVAHAGLAPPESLLLHLMQGVSKMRVLILKRILWSSIPPCNNLGYLARSWSALVQLESYQFGSLIYAIHFIKPFMYALKYRD